MRLQHWERSCAPAIVETKMDSRVHPCVVSPVGIGTRNRSAKPRPMLRSKGSGFAPGQVRAGACSDEAPAQTTADADTWTKGSCLAEGRHGFHHASSAEFDASSRLPAAGGWVCAASKSLGCF